MEERFENASSFSCPFVLFVGRKENHKRESILNDLNKDGSQGMRFAPHPPDNVGWSGQALAQGRKKETITMTSERERGSDRRRTKGRERDDEHRVVSSLEPRDATTGWFSFSTLG